MPGFGSVGIGEVILILVILLLVFGARRLPEIGSALGKGIREFKSSVKDIEGEIHRGSADRPRSELPRSESRVEAAPPARETEAEARTEPGGRTQAPAQSHTEKPLVEQDRPAR